MCNPKLALVFNMKCIMHKSISTFSCTSEKGINALVLFTLVKNICSVSKIEL